MNNLRDRRASSNVLVAGILCVTVIASMLLATRALMRIKRAGELIRVTGSAHRTIRADYIIWECTVTENRPQVADAYTRIKADVARVQTYLAAQNIPAAEIYVQPIETQAMHPPLNPNQGREDPTVARPIIGYQLTQNIQVKSNNVDIVDRAARNATELLSLGVPVNSQSPQYIYTQMDKLKLKMLEEAARDARNRADRIAASCGSATGELRYARTGITQVEAVSASEGVSDTGANDTSSIDKRVTAILKADFSIR